MNRIQILLVGLLAWAHRVAGHKALANIAEGVHQNGVFNFRSDAAIATRYLLGKRGSDDAHVAIAGAADMPLYVIQDEASAAEEPVACQAIACAAGSIRLVSNGAGALAAGDILVPAANGKVAKISASAGNYYVVGIATAAVAATDGEIVEAIPIGAWRTQ